MTLPCLLQFSLDKVQLSHLLPTCGDLLEASTSEVAVIEYGTQVRLKPEAFEGNSRPHLQLHARHADIGVVSGPSRQSPGMSSLYVIVHFPCCGHDHRLLAPEIEVIDESVAVPDAGSAAAGK